MAYYHRVFEQAVSAGVMHVGVSINDILPVVPAEFFFEPGLNRRHDTRRHRRVDYSKTLLRLYRDDIHPAGPKPVADNNAVGEFFYPDKIIRAGTETGYDQQQNNTDTNRPGHFRTPISNRILLQAQYTIHV